MAKRIKHADKQPPAGLGVLLISTRRPGRSGRLLLLGLGPTAASLPPGVAIGMRCVICVTNCVRLNALALYKVIIHAVQAEAAYLGNKDLDWTRLLECQHRLLRLMGEGGAWSK